MCEASVYMIDGEDSELIMEAVDRVEPAVQDNAAADEPVGHRKKCAECVGHGGCNQENLVAVDRHLNTAVHRSINHSSVC